MSIEQPNQGEAPPHAQLIQMSSAYWISKVVYAAAKLGLADQLAAGPKKRRRAGRPYSHPCTRIAPADAHPGKPRSAALCSLPLSRRSCIAWKPVAPASRRRWECRSSITSVDILRRRRCSARRWSASTVPSHRLLPLHTISRSSQPWWNVGGATGNMLAAILARHAGPRGVLFDMPHVVGDAPTLLSARGVEKRVTIQAGDFFKGVPHWGRRLRVVACHP